MGQGVHNAQKKLEKSNNLLNLLLSHSAAEWRDSRVGKECAKKMCFLET